MKTNEEIFELEKALSHLENLHASFDYLRINIASPEKIRSWAERELPNGQIIGEVLRPETINFRTHQPEAYGLFCERLFGPTKDWKCKCGKYHGFLLDKICEECDVELIESRVRRYRMGYIELSCPITHFWYLKGVPNYLCLLLQSSEKNLKVSNIENIVYFTPERDDDDNPLHKYIEIKRKPNELQEYLLSPWNFRRRGSEILKAALEDLDGTLKKRVEKFRSEIAHDSFRNIHKTYFPNKSEIRRIRVLESFLSTKTKPSWMILTILPVLPPALRPLLELENGRLVAADVNEFYRLIITRNERLADFINLHIAPDIITIQGRKLLQEGIDSLIDNARIVKSRKLILNNKALKSLTEILEGKQGRFRHSLLGKRVDYSGRSVIIVGPNLRLNQCGLPFDMAVELFEPFLVNELLKTKIKPPSHNTKIAYLIIKKNKPFVWSLLIELTLKYSVMLNRAPTLHRFGIQAFDPLLVLGQAIHLHPLVCTGFNADFDGDQMAVHLPLYESSQLEIRTMMRPSYNVLSPSNGEVILKPTQDMVIGNYYLTLMFEGVKIAGKLWFGNENEVLSALSQKKIHLHTPVLVRYLPSTFAVKKEKNRFFFYDKQTKLQTKGTELLIFQILKQGKAEEKLFLLTNFGIFLAYKVGTKKYKFDQFFLETTPGRILFSKNLKNFL